MAAERFGSVGWKIADALFFLMFVFAVVVQVNDPDPLPWMATCGAAAAACLLSLMKRLPWQFAVVTGIVALAWAAFIAPRVIGEVPFLDMFAEFEMKDIGVEESRQMYGLLLIGGWMAVLGHRAFWRTRQGFSARSVPSDRETWHRCQAPLFSRSPRAFTVSTEMRIAAPGKRASHGSVAMVACAWYNMFPQLAVGG